MNASEKKYITKSSINFLTDLIAVIADRGTANKREVNKP